MQRKFVWWRLLVAAVSVAVMVWSLLPLTSGIVNIGVVVPFAASLLGIAWGFSPVSLHKPKGWKRRVMVVAWVCIGLIAALGVVISSFMVAAAVDKPAGGESTVIVLGARIHGDRPSRMLRERLDVAADYLKENPEAKCIVSGGQGSDEQYTEARVMKTYLCELGIAPERIFEEDRSTDTHQNIDYSLAIIREQGLSERVAIATQEFHQYRAATLARRAGLTDVSAVTTPSPLYLLLCYWVRECAAICRLWIFGY
jgi:uncharacterized SAM-binding protein YcdF (DUF218 family)